jgi:hypothetical protein
MDAEIDAARRDIEREWNEKDQRDHLASRTSR